MSISNDSFKPVPWGPLGATIVALIALIGVDIVAAVAVTGFLWFVLDMSVSAALISLETNLIALFSYYVLARLTGLGVVYWFIRRRGGSLTDLGFRAFAVKKGLVVVALGLGGFFLMAAAVTVMLERFAPGIDITAEQEVPFLTAQGPELILAFLALVVIAPLAEEIVFRGLLLPAYANRVGVFLSIILTSILFGLLHPPVIAMITIGVFSLFLAWAYLKTDSIWPSILLHASKNLLAFVLVAMMGL